MLKEIWNAPFFLTAIALLGLVLLLVVFIWSVRRHRDPRLHIDSKQAIQDLLPSLAGLTLGTPLGGNSVEIYENGRYFDMLVERMQSAQHTVHFETFLWKEGVLGDRIAGALADRARAGKTVRVLLDATGCRKMGASAVQKMRDSGCKIAFFHGWNMRNIGVLNDRDHRKIVVIDGLEAFVGGHCVTDKWLGNAQDNEHFADISLALRGPVVHFIQSAFSENWAAETGELFVGDEVFPQQRNAGNAVIHAAFAKPERSAPAVKILYHTAICLAQTRIWIQNPYFIPDPEAIDALGQAVARGVDVRVLTPSARASDNPFVPHVAHRNFEKILRNGVRLFEYDRTLLHQKVMTVDGIWSAVGSSNFDDRSLETNDEIMVGICDASVTRTLDAIFEKYAFQSKELNLEEWHARSAWRKLADNSLYLLKSVF